jgi:glycosyltransferase involved in cell wall biosynthesis
MKVIYFHPHFSTPHGFAGGRSYQMAQRLLGHGHQVTMVCGRCSDGHTGLTQAFSGGLRSGEVDGIEVIEFELPLPQEAGPLKRAHANIRFLIGCLKLALTGTYDVLVAVSSPFPTVTPGIFARWLRGKPFVLELHGLWPELPQALGTVRQPVLLWLMGVFERIAYRSADRLIGLSPGIVRGIRERGISDDCIAMIPNAIGLEVLQGDVQAWRPEQVKDTDVMAVFAGDHDQAHGLDVVLGAAAELKRRHRGDIKLVLVGRGKLKGRLQEQAARQGLDNVVFLDPMSRFRLAGLLASAQVGMHIQEDVPALYFGTGPSAFFDHLSAGIPVLCNCPGWLAEILSRNQCGFVVPPKDAKALANTLVKAADHRQVLKTMGQNARRLAQTHFRSDALADRWVDWVTETD